MRGYPLPKELPGNLKFFLEEYEIVLLNNPNVTRLQDRKKPDIKDFVSELEQTFDSPTCVVHSLNTLVEEQRSLVNSYSEETDKIQNLRRTNAIEIKNTLKDAAAVIADIEQITSKLNITRAMIREEYSEIVAVLQDSDVLKNSSKEIMALNQLGEMEASPFE